MDDFFDKNWVRAGLAVTGLLAAAMSLFVLIYGIIDTVNTPNPDIAGAVFASLCMLFSGAAGAFTCWWGYTGLTDDSGETDDASPDVETQILEVAESHGGRVTVPMVAADTELSLSEADETLTRLAKQGLAQMNIDADGNNVYEFAGLDDPSEDTADGSVFDAKLAAARDAEVTLDPDPSDDETAEARQDREADVREES